MAKKFDFAFVQQKNLGLQFFAVTQAYVTFTVTGNDDPTTLQEMRDEVSDEFHKYQKRINEFIKNRNVEISKLSRKNAKSDAPKLVSGGHTTIQKFLGDFKRAADGKLAAYHRNQQKKAAIFLFWQ